MAEKSRRLVTLFQPIKEPFMSGAAACTSCMVLQLYDWLLWLRNLIVCVAFQ